MKLDLSHDHLTVLAWLDGPEQPDKPLPNLPHERIHHVLKELLRDGYVIRADREGKLQYTTADAIAVYQITQKGSDAVLANKSDGLRPDVGQPWHRSEETLIDCGVKYYAMHQHGVRNISGRVKVTILFADRSTRAVGISDANMQKAILAAFEEAKIYCTDETPSERGGQPGPFLQPEEAFGWELLEVRNVEALLYRNALVIDILLSDNSQERWVFDGSILEHHASYFCLIFA